MNRTLCAGLLAFTVGLGMLQTAEAGEAENKDAKRTQQRLRKLEQEKNQLSQQKSELEEKLKTSEVATDNAAKRAEAAARKVVQLNRDLDALRKEKDSLAEKLAETERGLQEEKLAHGNDKKRLEALAGRQLSVIGACRERNGKMYAFGNELVDRYEAKGCFTAVIQGEPFTGLARARIEAMAEEDRNRLDDLRLPAEAPLANAGGRSP